MNDWLPIVGVLVAVFIAWKLLKGVIKVGVIVLLIAFAAYWVLGIAG